MKTSKKFIVVSAAVTLLFSLALTGCSKKTSDKLTIGFYSTSQNITTNLQKQLTDFASTNNIEINFVALDNTSLDTTSLEKQIKKNHIDAVITSAGTTLNNCRSLQNDKAGVSTELLSPLFSTMREASFIKDNKATSLPLLIDHLEIDIDKQSFMDCGMQTINSWNDIENFCKTQQNKVEHPVVFAGSDPVFLMDLIGALAESRSGIESYNKAREILSEPKVADNFNASQLAVSLITNEDAPLRDAVHYIQRLFFDDYLNPTSKEFTDYDINVMSQERRARVIFTTLSSHRTYDAKGMSYFSTIYMPSKVSPDARHFTGNITYLVPLNDNSFINTVVDYLYTSETQADLSRSTGLAPVAAHCRTPDKQADDVRYWISATNVPLAGLGHETTLTSQQLEVLKAEILGIIFNVTF